MPPDFSRSFYGSSAWKDTREAYASSVGGLCEKCLSRGLYRIGDQVHHKVHLTPGNINDPTIALSFDNLELLCNECHHEVHRHASKKRFTVDEDGRVSAV